MKQQQRYIAIVIYEYSSPAPDHKTLYEESWSIVDADSEEHARQKVETLAQQNEDRYQNQYGETITVKAKHIVEVAPLLYQNQTISNGTELYARHFRNYQAYCEFEPHLGGEPL